MVSFAALVLPNFEIFYIKSKLSDTDKERGFRYFLKDQLSAGHMEKYSIDISCNGLKCFIWKNSKILFQFFIS